MATSIQYDGEEYTVAEDENILACLERNGINYPSSCKAGICQSCLIKATVGHIDPAWQVGIKDTLKSQGYFLACLAKPNTNLFLTPPLANECEADAKILRIEKVAPRVLKIQLEVTDTNIWTPGKYLSLINSEGVIRSYSIANLPVHDGFIELHLKTFTDGLMGTWFLDKANIGEQIKIRGPLGQCFYFNPDHLSFPMLLVGTGTGLAPLVAIARDALMQQHRGKVILIHGGYSDDDIYYVDELVQLTKQFPNFHYENCVLKGSGKYPMVAVDEKMLPHIQDAKNIYFYTCGPSETTAKIKKKAFLAGISSAHIFSDVFVTQTNG